MLKNIFFTVSLLLFLTTLNWTALSQRGWETLNAKGNPTARHEAGFVEFENRLYLIGGRGIKPVDVFDPATNSWAAKKKSPIEIHHFQPVVVGDAVYILGAFTGGYPFEKPIDRIIKYLPKTDEFVFGRKIPDHRQRGAASAVVYKGKIYLSGGSTNGHYDGSVPWLDEYDPETEEWKVLVDSPDSRDHAQAAVADDKMVVIGGRRSSVKTNQSFQLTTPYVNVYHFEENNWKRVSENDEFPTKRAGLAVTSIGGSVVAIGGESGKQNAGHDESEIFNPSKGKWQIGPSLNSGRHGTGAAQVGNHIYVASGSGNRGGGPELNSIERISLSELSNSRTIEPAANSNRKVYKKWHTLELSFRLENSSETARINPFTDFLLEVEFTHKNTKIKIRGFYAADGNALESGADAGNVWKVRFAPPEEGLWSYKARAISGKDVALLESITDRKEISLMNASGSFRVIETDKEAPDFRADGRLEIRNGYYRFKNNKTFLKVGANSPENFLAYYGFDGTYRIGKQTRDGEATAGGEVHRYAEHERDWRTGDPLLRNGSGKGIVGAINYLSSMGMNSVYFLTFNIEGDGKDVWMYRDPEDFSRFDVSKLEQWELLFSHMQKKGILLHFVTQETENELSLDSGETGRLRRLYYHELIARFGHHPGITWNLGEENGPADWSPKGQTDAQRIQMIEFFDKNDPYENPLIIHTHSTPEDKDKILPPLLGRKALDGLSFQVYSPKRAAKDIFEWKRKSKAKGHEWLITMDEIGMWHTGAPPDGLDPERKDLRRHVLWGSFLSGAAGVEWYFGARFPSNDLSSENWRERHQLWAQTKIAKDFFEKHTEYWKMSPCTELVVDPKFYCARKGSEQVILYAWNGAYRGLTIEDLKGDYTVRWFDPVNGGDLLIGNIPNVSLNGSLRGVDPPDSRRSEWVLILNRKN